MSSVCVFCGSLAGASDSHVALAAATGAGLARAGHRLIYGGGNAGLMGALANAALAAGGEVVGVIPDFLASRELGHPGLSRLEIVPTMHARKWRMLELANAVAALPGGIGTLDELIECITWNQLDLHDKPIWLLSGTGYWQPFLTLLAHVEAEGFAHTALRARVQTATSVDAMLATLHPGRALPF